MSGGGDGGGGGGGDGGRGDGGGRDGGGGARRTAPRTRREPAPFRRVVVRRVEHLSARMVRVGLAGDELAGMRIDQPAASVRLLLPSDNKAQLEMPTWNGNEFLLADGRRAVIRTFTPRRINQEALELDVDIVIHPGGVASGWAQGARPGAPAAVAGPARGYVIESDGPCFLLGGDETAIPAISQLLEALPPERQVHVFIEVAHPDGRLELPFHPNAVMDWCDLPPAAPAGDALVTAIRGAETPLDAAGVGRRRSGRRAADTTAPVRGAWDSSEPGLSPRLLEAWPCGW